jgi:G3E family GTPase
LTTPRPRIPLDLVTGFLGSGKTTLVNAVLRDPAFSGTVVVVNEFGDVGLDQLLVGSAADDVVLLDSGCLCCAVSGSLRDTLIDLFSRRASGRLPAFRRIIVETSGLANPAPMVASLLGDSALTPRCFLAQVLTLVDPVNGLSTLERYPEARRQVSLADRLLVGKADLAESLPAAGRQRLRDALHALNPHALVALWRSTDAAGRHFALLDVAARHTAAPQTWLRGPTRAQYGWNADADTGAPQCERADLGADPGTDTYMGAQGESSQAAPVHGPSFGKISSHVVPFPQTISWADYASWTGELRRRFGTRLLRCKGLMAIGDADAPWVVQGVQGYFASPARLPAWPADVRSGFMVCIGEAVTRVELDQTLRSIPS